MSEITSEIEKKVDNTTILNKSLFLKAIISEKTYLVTKYKDSFNIIQENLNQILLPNVEDQDEFKILKNNYLKTFNQLEENNKRVSQEIEDFRESIHFIEKTTKKLLNGLMNT